jgi:hypothetical protein
MYILNKEKCFPSRDVRSFESSNERGDIVHMHIFMFMHIRIIYIHMYINIHIYMYMCICIYIYIYVYLNKGKRFPSREVGRFEF